MKLLFHVLMVPITNEDFKEKKPEVKMQGVNNLGTNIHNSYLRFAIITVFNAVEHQ